MPGRDYEIFLFKLDFCPAPNKHSELGLGPNTEKLGHNVMSQPLSASWQ
ncbi:hypothetical protein [Staphylococcus marylandisciuri]|nr:hypothetical protein [Staphylococcus marylandisciuri]